MSGKAPRKINLRRTFLVRELLAGKLGEEGVASLEERLAAVAVKPKRKRRRRRRKAVDA